jgi:DNA-binding transcriptional regulator YdaS (Cro superfamily)
MGNKALIKAIKAAGSQSELARRIGKYPQLVQDWVSKNRPVPAKWVLQVEKASGVAKEELRPDLFKIGEQK